MSTRHTNNFVGGSEPARVGLVDPRTCRITTWDRRHVTVVVVCRPWDYCPGVRCGYGGWVLGVTATSCYSRNGHTKWICGVHIAKNKRDVTCATNASQPAHRGVCTGRSFPRPTERAVPTKRACLLLRIPCRLVDRCCSAVVRKHDDEIPRYHSSGQRQSGAVANGRPTHIDDRGIHLSWGDRV